MFTRIQQQIYLLNIQIKGCQQKEFLLFLRMIQNGVLRNLNDKERSEMIYIFNRTQKIRQFMRNIQVSMHRQFDQLLQSQKYACRICKQVCYGKQIGAHYRNNKKCKYMKDRPWLEQLPQNWQTDLQIFQEHDKIRSD